MQWKVELFAEVKTKQDSIHNFLKSTIATEFSVASSRPFQMQELTTEKVAR